jgi:adenylosuccinate lyase
MRRHDGPNAYEALKALTRGNTIDKTAIRQVIADLAIPESDKQRLLEMTPGSYTGLAKILAEKI